MRGRTRVQLCGNVSGPIHYGETTRGDPACSFVLVAEGKEVPTVFVRVNIYGGLVKVCDQRLKKGAYVIVDGGLMNRKDKEGGDNQSKVKCEVRCEDIIFVS